MNEAHVFQHKYTGVQIFVYHCIDEKDARYQFRSLVLTTDSWIYLGQKTATDAN